jgi:hypothetical protein
MKYFNLGLIKTKLISYIEILKKYKNVIHGEKIVNNNDENEIIFWNNVLENKNVDFVEYFKNYDVIMDIPFILFQDDIINQIKPILICTMRNFDEWYKSISQYFKIIEEYIDLMKKDREPIFKLFFKFRNYKINNISLSDASKDLIVAKKFYNNYHNEIFKKYPNIFIINELNDLKKVLFENRFRFLKCMYAH